MADFKTAMPLILRNEGGFTNDPDDHGGPTNYGITMGDYAEFKGRLVSTYEVRNMPMEDVYAIYKKYYWDLLKLDLVDSQKLAAIIFDQGVNRGIKRAAKDIQALVATAADGEIGPLSIAAINKRESLSLGLRFIAVAQNAYVGIVMANPSQIKFLPGWINRTHDLIEYLTGGLKI